MVTLSDPIKKKEEQQKLEKKWNKMKKKKIGKKKQQFLFPRNLIKTIVIVFRLDWKAPPSAPLPFNFRFKKEAIDEGRPSRAL